MPEESEVQERYGRIAGAFAKTLAGVRDDQWGDPTPCTDWDVRALVAHVVGTTRSVASTVLLPSPGEPAGSDAELPEIDPEGDLSAQFGAMAAAVSGSLADPQCSARTISGMFGEQSFESLVSRLLCADTLIHTWDLARATDQDDALDPDAVAVAARFLGPIDEAIRRPGGFAGKIDPEAGASDQVRLLNFAGRDVRWTAGT